MLLPICTINFLVFKPCSKQEFLEEHAHLLTQVGYSVVRTQAVPLDINILKSKIELESYFKQLVLLKEDSPGDFTAGLKVFYPKYEQKWYIQIKVQNNSVQAELLISDNMLILGLRTVKTIVSILGNA